VSPASHVWFATIQVLAPTTLTKVEGVLPEETSTISDFITTTTATCTHNSPSVSSIRTMVSEEHTSVTTTLKLKSDQSPASTHMRPGLSIAPAVQAIVVNCVSVVDPQLASIIRDNSEMVVACPKDSQAACPAHSKVITAGKTGPSATCVFIVHIVSPACHVRSAALQIRAPPTLTKVEGILPEETMAISSGIAGLTSTSRAHNHPSVSSIRTSVPEEHPSMTTTLKHFKFHKVPSGTLVLGGLAIAPAMQAIVVDCVTIVDPQLAAVI